MVCEFCLCEEHDSGSWKQEGQLKGKEEEMLLYKVIEMAWIREEEKDVTANFFKRANAKVENSMMLKTKANKCQENGKGIFEIMEVE